MTDTTSLLFGSFVSFLLSIAIGRFGKRSLAVDMLMMLGVFLVTLVGYFLIFSHWPEEVGTGQLELLAFFYMYLPGFVIYFLLPLIPGYMLGILIKHKYS